jgi:hypothetical protein
MRSKQHIFVYTEIRITMRAFALAVLVVILGLSLPACSSPETTNPINPSYRLVTTQILEIDSALGTRGGLAALTKTSSAPTIPEGMLHGSSLDLSALESSQKVDLNWALIGRRAATIEGAWEDLRAELDRRALDAINPSWEEGYLEWFKIMAVKHDFETGLEAVKLDVSEKREERIALSVAVLTQGFVETKDVLSSDATDGRRVTLVSVGFVSILVCLTVAASLIARWRDRRFVETRTLAQPSQPPAS